MGHFCGPIYQDIPGHGWEPQTIVDRQGDEVMAGTVKDKERRREKKDLIGWCIKLRKPSTRYSLQSPCRMRSRWSMLKDEGKVYSYGRNVYAILFPIAHVSQRWSN
jgi:hypothetical protein